MSQRHTNTAITVESCTEEGDPAQEVAAREAPVEDERPRHPTTICRAVLITA